MQPDVWKLTGAWSRISAFPLDVALVVGGPCFVDLDENGRDEAQERLVVGKDPDLDGAALELLLDGPLDGLEVRKRRR